MISTRENINLSRNISSISDNKYSEVTSTRFIKLWIIDVSELKEPIFSSLFNAN